MSVGTVDRIAGGLEKMLGLFEQVGEAPHAAELRANISSAIDQRRQALAAVVANEATGGAQTVVRLRELDDILARAAPLLGFDHPEIVRLSAAAIHGAAQWPR